MRLRLNRQLFLGLFDYEAMFAHYPQWQNTDGGELLVYRKKQPVPVETLLPMMGTMVIFLSEKFPHEVLAAQRSRFSLTGWFRVNDFIQPGLL